MSTPLPRVTLPDGRDAIFDQGAIWTGPPAFNERMTFTEIWGIVAALIAERDALKEQNDLSLAQHGRDAVEITELRAKVAELQADIELTQGCRYA